MPVYKIFPIVDTTIYSKNRFRNASIDEMLEIGTYNNAQFFSAESINLSSVTLDDIRRTIIKFDTDEIKSTIRSIEQEILSTNQLTRTSQSLVSNTNYYIDSGSQIDYFPVTASQYGAYVSYSLNKSFGADYSSSTVITYSPGDYIPKGVYALYTSASYTKIAYVSGTLLPSAAIAAYCGQYTSYSYCLDCYPANTTSSVTYSYKQGDTVPAGVFPTYYTSSITREDISTIISSSISYSYVTSGTLDPTASAQDYTSSAQIVFRSASVNFYTITGSGFSGSYLVGILTGSKGFSGSYVSSSVSSSVGYNDVSSSYQVNLKLYLASAENLYQNYAIEAHAVRQQWSHGTGKYVDVPETINGVGWEYRGQAYNSPKWSNEDGNWSILTTRGGGNWNTTYSTKSFFTYASNKDIDMNVTNMVNYWHNASDAENNGFLLKFTGSVELQTASYMGLKFYSVETHTIYPPCLEFMWDDSTFNTGSTPYNVVTDDQFTLISNNNRGEYKENSTYQFRFTARDQYPQRKFQTSSVYLDWKFLPSQSLYGIQDYKTKEMVVDFHSKFTKLSVDPSGSFFTLKMRGLEPERSYKILISSSLSTGEHIVIDRDIIFKVIR